MTEAAARSLLDQAKQAGSQRDYSKAVELLLRLLSEHSGMSEAYLYLGRAYHALGQHGKAVASLRAAVEGQSDPSQALFFLGRAYLAMGLNDQACFCLEQCLARDWSPPQVLGLLGYAYLRRRQVSKAVETLEQAIKLAPDDARIYRAYLNALLVSGIRALRREEFDLAAQTLAFVVENGLDQTHSRLYYARALSALGRWDDASSQYEACLADSGEDPSILANYAFALASSGHLEDAQTIWEGLKHAIPGLPETISSPESANLNAAITELKANHWKAAIGLSIQGLKRDPRSSMFHAIAGEAYRSLGTREKALAHFDRAIEADKGNLDLRSARLMTLWEAGQHENLRHELQALSRLGADRDFLEYYELLLAVEAPEPRDKTQLIPKLLSYVERMGPDQAMMMALAKLSFNQGLFRAALSWYAKILESPGDHELERLSIIACHEALGDVPALDASYRDYMARFPDNSVIGIEYAEFLRAQGLYARAAEAYQSMVPYLGSSTGLLKLIAQCRRLSGAYREAAVIYRDLALKHVDTVDYPKDLAFCLYRMGKASLAAELMESCARRFPSDIDGRLILAFLYREAKKFDKAAKVYEGLMGVKACLPQAYNGLSKLYQVQGMAEQARRYAQLAREATQAPKSTVRKPKS